MSKMRIYEYAKKNNVENKKVIETLNEMGMDVTNHMVAITEETQQQLDKTFNPSSGQEEKPAENKQKSTEKKPKKKKSNNKKAKNKQEAHKQQERKPKSKNETPSKVFYEGTLTVSELAEKLNKDSSEILKKLLLMGVMANKNQTLDSDTIELIGDEFGVEVEEKEAVDETDIENLTFEDNPEDLEERPAVVTIMGHVDHGKTTLLDSIRNTKVTAGEAGGITQHIGAYQIEENDKKVTFLDTPGHAAFTSMRSRGAQVTDIAILVVAADDGVMPQTREAISHAKAAEVPIIVAVNKMDVEGANPDRIMQELMQFELVAEDYGGDTIFVKMSALAGEGIDELLEMITLVSEMEELKANPARPAFGTVIEAELDKGRGPVATLLVQNGTLNVGDSVVVGNTYGRVRAMVNDIGRRVKEAAPSTPVEVTGLNDVPHAGDRFLVFEDEKRAKSIGEARKQQKIEEERRSTQKVSLDDLFEQIQQGELKEINLILKADVQGSVEALAGSLEKIEVEDVKVNIIHTGVGAITESDVSLAAASSGVIIGFNVRPDGNARKAAEGENVEIRLHNVIYKAIEEIEAAMKGMLDPEFEEKIIGQVEVREIFKVSKIGTIAGSYVTDGKINRNAGVRVIRDGVVIFEGEIDQLKRYKDDAKEVVQGYECGITVKNFNDIKVGDIIEPFVMEEVERT
ncbi:translation initiation factor IF-2 [Salimicrobium jeotgali]|uniref:Translation initiation factor IF-2 n=1 Tax=Salimicrobium jeotgali TaxID=1230341 RepID=K2HB18_9BACI|nr:translation initiation factor IF-2 [Salimicrobium jeotgali]AKG04543.1 translation initiation factor IF-2 [Salimicrobium jeotgali]EKE32755.1 translation initiation factor IF-2 [Salimicrobium jeotgali]MBM7695257.1 translation initiation factor IF-2 [Salimicrobium jeotgali]